MADAERERGAARLSPAPLTDRANSEPAIMRGLTASETQLAAFIALPFWVVVGVLVAIASEVWALGVLIASLAPMVTVWMLGGRLASIKRDRPDGFYMHKFWQWRAKAGLGESPFITHDGYWDIGRDIVARTGSGRRH